MQIFADVLVMLSTMLVLNNNGPTYTTLMKQDNYELRRYDSWVVAETIVEGTQEDVGHEAFNRLGGYIFGKNDQGVKIDMTAPVTQYEISEGKYAIQFYMPAIWTLDTLPKPTDSRVILKEVPERTLFVIRYQGNWSDRHYNQELLQLSSEAQVLGIEVKPDSQPIWARYNSPMTPTILRTNEIMFEVNA